MTSHGQALDPQALTPKVKLLLNAQLKSVLKSEGLPVSGVKASMQQRIIDRIHHLHKHNDIEGLRRIGNLIVAQGSTSGSYGSPSPSSTASVGYNHASMTGSRSSLGPGSGVQRNPQSHSHGRLSFKDSPFYTIEQSLTPVMECNPAPNVRQTMTTKLCFSALVNEKLRNDPAMRVMVYCAMDESLSPYTKSDITFPHQVELKVNGDEVRQNLRGLKNRPGSTKPADITDFVRKMVGYENTVAVTYALTQKKFSFIINLVRRHSVGELVTRLRNAGRSFSKDQVVKDMVSKAQDVDIVATSSIMSLKCPLSTLRMKLPCRSAICSHNQCFDAESFLQLQEQGPTWTCPICNKLISFEGLIIDRYVEDILKSTSKTVEQVVIEPNGSWSENTEQDSKPSDKSRSRSGGDNDDLVEIENPRLSSVKPTATPTSAFGSHTPPTSSREPSTSATHSNSHKRPASAVIDLTLSDDEDDQELVRNVKRRVTYVTPTSSSNFRNTSMPTNGSGGSKSDTFSFRMTRPSQLMTPGPSDAGANRYGRST